MAPNRHLTGTGVSRSARAARMLGGIALIATGAVHLQQYFAVYYRVIPVIGPLFLANFIIAVLLGLALLTPIERFGRALAILAALGGIAFAAGTIIGLAISESGTLFGFHEHGYRAAIVASLAFEAAAIVLLAGYTAAARPRRTATPAHTSSAASSSPSRR